MLNKNGQKRYFHNKDICNTCLFYVKFQDFLHIQWETGVEEMMSPVVAYVCCNDSPDCCRGRNFSPWNSLFLQANIYNLPELPKCIVKMFHALILNGHFVEKCHSVNENFLFSLMSELG